MAESNFQTWLKNNLIWMGFMFGVIGVAYLGTLIYKKYKEKKG